jgi:hypothetical protein
MKRLLLALSAFALVLSMVSDTDAFDTVSVVTDKIKGYEYTSGSGVSFTFENN